jgi:hypothetical protein
MPPNAAVAAIAVNPANLPEERNALVITGLLRGGGGADRTAAVVDLVSRLQGDSAFAYRNVRLISSRAATNDAPVTEFTIECR